MNAGHHRIGGAIGFRVNFLTQLKSLKTTDNKSTLLHFVAGTVERKFPMVLEFAEDLSHTTAAARGMYLTDRWCVCVLGGGGGRGGGGGHKLARVGPQ